MTNYFPPLVIINAGGHGRVIADIAEQLGYSNIIFVDDRFPQLETNLHWQVVAKNIDELNVPGAHVFVAIGACDLRLKLSVRLLKLGYELPSLIHSTASVSPYAKLGVGSVCMPHAIINIGTKIGIAAIINSGATVDHDCEIGDGVHISPGAHIAGGVTIGQGSWIGIGSSIKENIVVGCNTIVGAGSAVVKNFGDNLTVVGNPAQEKVK